jgi:hypothetical protein
MGQPHSFDDAGYAVITPSVGVPTLDWPSDLFSDNASPSDLATVDFVCDPEFVLDLPPGEYIQLAA